jgi:hypothetical protein
MIAMMSFMTAAPVLVSCRAGAEAPTRHRLLADLRRQRRICLKTMPNAAIYGKEKSLIWQESPVPSTATRDARK